MNEQDREEKGGNQIQEPKRPESGNLEKTLEVTAWGLFFIWVGIAYLASMSFAVGLLGVGVITLGAQLARKYYKLKVEQFWIVVGLLLVISGLWELFGLKFQLVPILIIIAGLVILVTAYRGKLSKK
jgi:hypothetical protein